MAHTSASAPYALDISPARYAQQPAPLTALPFVADVKAGRRTVGRSFWRVAAQPSYVRGNAQGAGYGAHLLAYLRQNPAVRAADMLTLIARDMPAESSALDGDCGTRVGFWFYLGEAIDYALRNGFPVERVAQQQLARYETQEEKETMQ